MSNYYSKSEIEECLFLLNNCSREDSIDEVMDNSAMIIEQLLFEKEELQQTANRLSDSIVKLVDVINSVTNKLNEVVRDHV